MELASPERFSFAALAASCLVRAVVTGEAEAWDAVTEAAQAVVEPGPPLSPEEQDLWRRYVAHRDLETRGILVERNLHLARKIAASQYALRFDDAVEFADYLQYARVGLLEALDRFDPEREASFGTFAQYRIRGAILNAIQRTSERAAQHGFRTQMLKERTQSLRGEGRDRFSEMVNLTIGLALGYVLEDSGLWKEADDDAASDPYQMYELKALSRRLSMILDAMPARERQLVKRHYFEHADFSALASEMGISKGRVSQLHARALKLMREAYEALDRFDVSF